MTAKPAVRGAVELVATRALAAERHPAAVFLARLAEGSRRTMREALDTIAALLTSGRADAVALDWSALRYQHAQAVRADLAGRYSPATVNKMLSALRGVLREAWRLGLMSAEDYHRTTDLERVRGENIPRGRALAGHEIAALFEACALDENTAAGARDAALLAILYGAGVRRAEAAALDVKDYDGDTDTLKIRNGKGRKARLVYVTDGGKDALEAWLAARGEKPGPLFVPVGKGGRVELRPMTPQAIYDRLRKRAKEADIKSFSPHDLRRTAIGDLLDAGADISTVQRLAGHASVVTTARYDRRPETAKKRAAELLRVPFVAPRSR